MHQSGSKVMGVGGIGLPGNPDAIAANMEGIQKAIRRGEIIMILKMC